MMRYFIFILLVLFCVNSQSKNFGHHVQKEHENFVLQKDRDISMILTITTNYYGHDNNESNYVSYKSTQHPNTSKPTTKSGTYLQSIWDIYFP